MTSPDYKRPRKDRVYTEADKEICFQMRRDGSALAAIAARLGVTKRTLKKHFAAQLQLGDPIIEAQLTFDMIRMALNDDYGANKFLLETKFGWSTKPLSPAPGPTPWTHNDPFDMTIKPGFGQYVVNDDPPVGWKVAWPPEGCILRSSAERYEAQAKARRAK